MTDCRGPRGTQPASNLVARESRDWRERFFATFAERNRSRGTQPEHGVTERGVNERAKRSRQGPDGMSEGGGTPRR